MRPLVFLVLRQIKNSFKGSGGRPKILLPGCILFFLLAVSILPSMLLGRPSGDMPNLPFAPVDVTSGTAGTLVAAVRTLLLLSIVTSIAGSLGDGGLAFSNSDIDFLFPSPIRKRVVLFSKMLMQYVTLLFTTFYFPFVMGGSMLARQNIQPISLWPGILGTWLFLIATTNIMQTVLLRRADTANENEAAETKRKTVRRVLGWFLLIAIIGLVTFFLTDIRKNFATLGSILQVVNGPIATTVLAPVAWASDLYLVPFEGWTQAAFLRLFGILAFVGASFALLFSRERHFYENAVDVSAKVAQVRDAQQRGDTGAILSQMAQDGKLKSGRSLRDFGGGMNAIIWKDLVSLTRVPAQSWLTLAFLAIMPAGIALFMNTGRAKLGEAGIVFWMVFFLLNTSSIFLLSLRDMLRRADITKALPITPVRVLIGEILLGIVQLTLMGWLSLGALTGATMALKGSVGTLTAVAALCLPSFALVLNFVQTCFVLLYPNKQDVAQNAIGGIVSLFFTSFALAPAILVGVLLTLLRVPWPLVALAVTGMNLAVGALGIFAASILWQRFDPTD